VGPVCSLPDSPLVKRKPLELNEFPNGEFSTQSGVLRPPRFWNSGEPNNVGHHGEDCVTIYSSGHWNDATCSNSEAWICERSC